MKWPRERTHRLWRTGDWVAVKKDFRLSKQLKFYECWDIEVHYHTQLALWCWGLNSGLRAYWTRTPPTGHLCQPFSSLSSWLTRCLLPPFPWCSGLFPYHYYLPQAQGPFEPICASCSFFKNKAALCNCLHSEPPAILVSSGTLRYFSVICILPPISSISRLLFTSIPRLNSIY